MKNYFNIIENDIFILDDFDTLYKLYNNNDAKNKPFAIIVCMEGEVEIEINMKTHKIMPKQIMVYLPYNATITRYRASSDFSGKILCLSERIMIENFNMGNNLWEKSFAISKNPIIDINKEVASLFECYGRLIYLRYTMKERMYKKEVITALLKAIMYELLNEVNSTTAETPGKNLLKQGDILFKKFITLLSRTEIKPRMVTWYAEELHVTPKYLSTTCKNVSGKTANVWINQFVVKDICQLLRYSEMSIKEISEHLNFPNLSFFGKYVKSHLGVSPKEYRQQIRDEISL